MKHRTTRNFIRLLQALVFGLTLSPGALSQDVLRLAGGSAEPGEPIDLPVYVRDIQGTLIDTTANPNDGFFSLNMKLFFNSDLVTDAEFLEAGATVDVDPFIFADFSDAAQGRAQLVCSYSFDRMPVNLGAPAPGDLVAVLRLTPSSQANGQNITFTFDDQDTNLTGFNGVPTLVVSEGTLDLQLGTVAVGGGTGNLPSIDHFEVNPETIPQGGQSTISWQVSNSDTVSIDQGIGMVGPIGSGFVSPGVTTTYTMTATNGSGSVQATATVTVTPANTPTIHYFEVNPNSIEPGQSANLAWFVSDADTVTIDQGIGAVAPEAILAVMPATTTTYTLTATNGFGSAQQPVTLTVATVEPPTIQSFTASPGTIAAGGSATLFWIVENADSVQINQGIGAVAVNGSVAVMPPTTTTYTLTATNAVDSVQRTRTVTVTDQPVPQILSFTANPDQLVEGEFTTIAWQVQNADTVDIGPGIGRVSSNGSLQRSPGTDTTYELLAMNVAGENRAMATVQVFPRTEILLLELSPTQISLGESATLTWEAVNADSLVLDPGGQAVGDSGSMLVQPQETTEYTLTATGPLGQLVDVSVELVVTGEPALALDRSVLNFSGSLDSLQVELSANTQEAANWSLAGLPPWLESDENAGLINADNPVVITFSVDRNYFFPGQQRQVDIDFSAAGLVPATLEITASRPEQGGETYLYFPLLEGNEDKYSDLSVVNLAEFSVDGLLQIFDGNGILAMDPVEFNLAPLASYRAEEIEALATGRGWAVASLRGQGGETEGLTASGCANIRSRDGEELYTLSPVSSKADFLYVPHIALNTTSFYTLSSVVNLDSETRDLSLETGAIPDVPLGPSLSGGQNFFNFLEAFGGTIQGPGWGQLVFDPMRANSLAGAEVFGLTEMTGVQQVVGVGLSGNTSSDLYFVHIAQNLASFWTGIVVINLAQTAVSVQFEPYDSAGALIDGGFGLMFEANEKRTFLVSGNQFDFGEGATWVKVSADAPLIGYELFGTHPPGDQFAGFENIGTLSNKIVFPHTEEGVSQGGYTGLSIINPGTVAADLAIRLVSADGQVKETNESQPISPKEKLVTLATDLFETSIALGDIILVESAQKIAGFELYGAGTKTMGALAAWPD